MGQFYWWNKKSKATISHIKRTGGTKDGGDEGWRGASEERPSSSPVLSKVKYCTVRTTCPKNLCLFLMAGCRLRPHRVLIGHLTQSLVQCCVKASSELGSSLQTFSRSTVLNSGLVVTQEMDRQGQTLLHTLKQIGGTCIR